MENQPDWNSGDGNVGKLIGGAKAIPNRIISNRNVDIPVLAVFLFFENENINWKKISGKGLCIQKLRK